MISMYAQLMNDEQCCLERNSIFSVTVLSEMERQAMV
jgi:hypothetical protein